MTAPSDLPPSDSVAPVTTAAVPVPVAAPATPDPASVPVSLYGSDDNVAEDHTADLQRRQAQADENDRQQDAMHDALSSQPPPSNAPQPVPTVQQQPSRLVEARFLPDGAVSDIARGVLETPDMIAAGGGILKGWSVATKAGKIVRAMAQGALTDFGAFDAHQARLFDLLKTHAPDALKPVFDYLASDPRDGEVEGRLKNALEGVGLGAATHGVINRHMNQAKGHCLSLN